MKPPSAEMWTADPSPHDFYANLFYVERRKCLAITHAGTLFSAFLSDVSASDLRPIAPLMIEHIESALERADLDREQLGTLDPADCHLAKTASRSVLASMNDMVLQFKRATEIRGGLAHVDMKVLTDSLNKTVHSAIGPNLPVLAAAEWQPSSQRH